MSRIPGYEDGEKWEPSFYEKFYHDTGLNFKLVVTTVIALAIIAVIILILWRIKKSRS